jgi:hypothetical protein
MRLKVRFYRTKKGWRWNVATINNTRVGSSPAAYGQRVSCLRNFRLLTGMDAPAERSHASDFRYIVTMTKHNKRPIPHWDAVSR